MKGSRVIGAMLLLLWSESLTAEMIPTQSPSVQFINQHNSDPALQFSDHSIDVMVSDYTMSAPAPVN